MEPLEYLGQVLERTVDDLRGVSSPKTISLILPVAALERLNSYYQV